MNLAFAYTLAGADCIDMSADEAVVTAVAEVSSEHGWVGERKSSGPHLISLAFCVNAPSL